MNRRDFLRGLFAAIVGALVPWKFGKQAPEPVESVVVDWRDSGEGAQPLTKADFVSLYNYWARSRGLEEYHNQEPGVFLDILQS